MSPIAERTEKLKVLRRTARIVSIGLAVLALVLFFWTGFCWFMSSASTMFHRVTGKVMVSDVSGHRGTRSYRKLFRYRYEIDGVTYESGTIRFGANDEAEIKSYRPDQPVSVYHDPHNPGIACLKPGVYDGIYWGMAKVVLLLILSVLSFCFGKYYLDSSD